MQLQGSSVLVTGAGAGIGKAAVHHFLSAGAKVTALDVSDAALRQLAQDAGFQAALLVVRCDVSKDGEQAGAFEQHMARWGRLDVAFLNAGISESGRIFDDDDISSWQRTLDVDLRAALVGIHLAARAMIRSQSRGLILSVASAAGVFALPHAPIYSAAKGGLVHFTRSAAAGLVPHGIRLCTICPQFVDTGLVAALDAPTRAYIASSFGTLLTPQRVVQAACDLIADGSRNGVAAVLLQNGKHFDWQPMLPVRNDTPAGAGHAPARPAARALEQTTGAGGQRGEPTPALPQTYRAWQVQKLSHVFTDAARLVSLPIPRDVPPDCVLVKRVVTGVNASDVNFTSGKYHGSVAEAQKELPFVAGFESVGVVVRAGTKSGLAVGQAVATLTFGGFSEYAVERARMTVPVPSASPAAVTFLTSGLTASIALEQAGQVVRGETVLVTAAAGGTGAFAVQLAKLAGAHVIGTCSSAAKTAQLKQLGCDRVINYREESMKEVLRREYGKGVDVVYEAVGGDMFKVAADALAVKGRLIVIGMMSQYGEGWPVANHPGLPEKLLKKSATITGFFLPHYAAHYKRHLDRLFELHASGQLTALVDSVPFVGIQAVPAAVEHLQSGASTGKVVVYVDNGHAPATNRSRM